MTTHQLAALLDHLRQGFGAGLKADVGNDFTEASTLFRELPEQPLKEWMRTVRKGTAAPSAKPSKTAVDLPQVIEQVRAVRAGGTVPETLLSQIESLKSNQLKEILVAFGQKGTTTIAGNVDRVKQLLTVSQNGSHPTPPPAAPVIDERAVEEGLRTYTRLRDDKSLTIHDAQAGFEPLKNYPKPVVEEISRRLGFTPSGSRDDILKRLLSNLEGVKMSQLRAELIHSGS